MSFIGGPDSIDFDLEKKYKEMTNTIKSEPKKYKKIAESDLVYTNGFVNVYKGIIEELLYYFEGDNYYNIWIDKDKMHTFVLAKDMKDKTKYGLAAIHEFCSWDVAKKEGKGYIQCQDYNNTLNWDIKSCISLADEIKSYAK